MVPLARGSGKEIGKGSGKHDRRAVKAQASSGRKSFGGVPERSKGSDCKSDGYAFEGSNPSPTTMICGTGLLRYRKALRERYAGMVQW